MTAHIRVLYPQLFEGTQHIQVLINRFWNLQAGLIQQILTNPSRPAGGIGQKLRYCVDFPLIGDVLPSFLRDYFQQILAVLLQQIIQGHEHTSFNGTSHFLAVYAARALNDIWNIISGEHLHHFLLELFMRNQHNVQVGVRHLLQLFHPFIIIQIGRFLHIVKSQRPHRDREFSFLRRI
ncbi:hypothetical protein D3C78_1270690 [compost metagenome]